MDAVLRDHLTIEIVSQTPKKRNKGNYALRDDAHVVLDPRDPLNPRDQRHPKVRKRRRLETVIPSKLFLLRVPEGSINLETISQALDQFDPVLQQDQFPKIADHTAD